MVIYTELKKSSEIELITIKFIHLIIKNGLRNPKKLQLGLT